MKATIVEIYGDGTTRWAAGDVEGDLAGHNAVLSLPTRLRACGKAKTYRISSRLHQNRCDI